MVKAEMEDGRVGQERHGEMLARHGAVVQQMVARRIPRRWRSVLSPEDVMQQTYMDAVRSIDQL